MRRQDPLWRGCNVTIPHKERVLAHLDRLDPGAEAVGAVNCIVPRPEGLVGYNSDVDGVAVALGGVELIGRSAVVIGGGGGARAALRYMSERNVGMVTVLVRNPDRAAHLEHGGAVAVRSLSNFQRIAGGASVIINASPLGMRGGAPMPAELLACLPATVAGKTLFDMVYEPLETPFLAAGRAGGGSVVDGLTMLVGQARAAFQLFFGQAAPPVPPVDLRQD
jgi:shikimate dehydrogenase